MKKLKPNYKEKLKKIIKGRHISKEEFEKEVE